jgi:NAD(P)-dependent dehydrogenase (short-subunit alcohol dehydrogenase family)
VAETFASAGARVTIASDNAAACEDAAHQMRSKGWAVQAQPCDVTDSLAQARLVTDTLDREGGIDILVANAGITDAMVGSTGGLSADYRRVMATNLDSIVELCGLVVPAIKARGGGSLVLMSSLAGQRGNGRIGPYALAKAALSQLARNLAVELGPHGIRANAIAPGFIRTDLGKALLADPAFMARRMQHTPLRRPGEPHEIAAAALLLASPGGAFITGQTLVIDGGTLVSDGS